MKTLKNEIYQHIATGNLYLVVDTNGHIEKDWQPAIFYTALDGTKGLIARPVAEFEDGRFKHISRDEMLEITRTKGIFVKGWKYYYALASHRTTKETQTEVFYNNLEGREDVDYWEETRGEAWGYGGSTDRNGYLYYKKKFEESQKKVDGE